MKISVSEAKAQLTELVRRVEAGEDVVLTLDGRPVVRLVPLKSDAIRAARRKVIAEVRAAAAGNPSPGPCAARSQDFLYDDDGLPA